MKNFVALLVLTVVVPASGLWRTAAAGELPNRAPALQAFPDATGWIATLKADGPIDR